MKAWRWLPLILLSFTQASLASLKDIKYVATGFFTTCYGSANKVRCIGNTYDNMDQTISGFKNIKSVTTLFKHVCVHDEDGVWCWGVGQPTGAYTPPMEF